MPNKPPLNPIVYKDLQALAVAIKNAQPGAVLDLTHSPLVAGRALGLARSKVPTSRSYADCSLVLDKPITLQNGDLELWAGYGLVVASAGVVLRDVTLRGAGLPLQRGVTQVARPLHLIRVSGPGSQLTLQRCSLDCTAAGPVHTLHVDGGGKVVMENCRLLHAAPALGVKVLGGSLKACGCTFEGHTENLLLSTPSIAHAAYARLTAAASQQQYQQQRMVFPGAEREESSPGTYAEAPPPGSYTGGDAAAYGDAAGGAAVAAAEEGTMGSRDGAEAAAGEAADEGAAGAGGEGGEAYTAYTEEQQEAGAGSAGEASNSSSSVADLDRCHFSCTGSGYHCHDQASSSAPSTAAIGRGSSLTAVQCNWTGGGCGLLCSRGATAQLADCSLQEVKTAVWCSGGNVSATTCALLSSVVGLLCDHGGQVTLQRCRLEGAADASAGVIGQGSAMRAVDCVFDHQVEEHRGGLCVREEGLSSAFDGLRQLQEEAGVA